MSLRTHEFLMREEIRKLLSSLRAFEPKTVSNGKQEFLSIPDLPNFSSSPSRFQKTSAAAVTCLQPWITTLGIAVGTQKLVSVPRVRY